MSSDDPGQLPQMFGLFRVVGIMRTAFGRRLAKEDWVHEAGVKPPTYVVLRTIGAMQPVSQKEVADRVGLYPSDLVTMIDQLEDLGWIERGRDPNDRRRHQLALTDQGRKIVDRFDVIAHEVEDEVLGPLDDELRIALAEAADRIIEGYLDQPSAAGDHHAEYHRLHHGRGAHHRSGG